MNKMTLSLSVKLREMGETRSPTGSSSFATDGRIASRFSIGEGPASSCSSTGWRKENSDG